jgi:putative inorganic carbon (HCO3(-)) transporter
MEMKLRSKFNLLIIITLCITPLIITPFIADYFYYPKIFIIYIINLIIAVMCIKYKENPLIIGDNSERILIIYFVLITVSTINSENHSLSLWGTPLREEGLIALLAYGILFIITRKYYQFSIKHVYLYLASASVIAIYGILQYFEFDPIPRDYIRAGWYHMAFSTIGNPNFFGTYLVLALPISIFTYIALKKYIFLLTSSIIYLALLCSNTRGAWLGAIFSLLVLIYFIYRFKFSKKNLFIILISFLLITILLDFYTNGEILGRFITISENVKDLKDYEVNIQDGGSVRIFIWGKVVKIIKEYPIFGIGIGNLGNKITKDYSNEIVKIFGTNLIFDKAHNEYLNIAVSTGIPSLILYLCFILSIIKKVFGKVRNNYCIIPIFCSVIGYLIQAFFNISVVSVAFIYWIFLGILLNFVTDHNQGANVFFNKDK